MTTAQRTQPAPAPVINWHTCTHQEMAFTRGGRRYREGLSLADTLKAESPRLDPALLEHVRAGWIAAQRRPR